MRAILAALLLAGCPARARAQVCSVSATPLSFGSYDPFAPGTAAITGGVTVSCRATIALNFSYVVQLGPGANGSLAQRNMAGSAGRLAYQLYTDAARTIVWGDGTGGTGTVGDGYLLAALATINRTYTVYGAVPPLQRTSPGAYTDVVTVLVVY